MANTTTKRRFDPQWATGLVLVGALGFAVGAGLRAYQLPENPTAIVQTVAPPVPQPAQLRPTGQHQPKPQVVQQPRVIRVVRVIRRPVFVTRGS